MREQYTEYVEKVRGYCWTVARIVCDVQKKNVKIKRKTRKEITEEEE